MPDNEKKYLATIEEVDVDCLGRVLVCESDTKPACVQVVKEIEKPVEIIKEVPVEVVKEVPIEVIKEVEIIKEVEKPVEIIKEVPVEIVKEVPVEVIKEVEIIKEVEKPVEIIKEVPVEVVKEVEKIVYVEVPVEVVKEAPVACEEEPAIEEEPAAEEQEAVSEMEEEIAATTAEAVIIDEENEDGEEIAFDMFGNVIRYRKSFMAKLIQTQYPNQDYYEELKNELLSYKGVKSRVSWNYDSFNKGRKKCVKLAIKGKTLIMYIALDPNEYNVSKYHHFDASDVSRFVDVPFGLKIRSDRALKYAKELIAILMAELGLVKREIKYENYHRRYETTEKLIKQGLIKVIGGNNQAYEGETNIGEELEVLPEVEPLEELPDTFEEEVVALPDDMPVVDAPAKPKYVNKSFAQKMLLADEVLQDRYDELKNYALRFKKLKARISKKFDSINKGRLQFVKLSVAGKTLKLFLNMDIMTTDPKFHCKDMRDKKTYETVPVLLRIKSGRAVKYAKILIDQCAESHGLVENKKFQEVDAIALVEQAVASKKKN